MLQGSRCTCACNTQGCDYPMVTLAAWFPSHPPSLCLPPRSLLRASIMGMMCNCRHRMMNIILSLLNITQAADLLQYLGEYFLFLIKCALLACLVPFVSVLIIWCVSIMTRKKRMSKGYVTSWIVTLNKEWSYLDSFQHIPFGFCQMTVIPFSMVDIMNMIILWKRQFSLHTKMRAQS